MSSSENAANNLGLSIAIAGNAQAQADSANRRAADAENRAFMAELNASGKTTDRDLERRLDEANSRERIATYACEAVSKTLAEKEALLLEWRVSQMGFRKLAKAYGAKLELSPEQITIDVRQMFLEAAEEEPDLANTDAVAKAKEFLANAKK